jgi:UDP-glucose 4-epimerase
VFIEDLVDGIYRASVSRTPSRIFNLGSGRGISLNQLLSVIRRYREGGGRPLQRGKTVRRAGDLSRY